MHDTYLSDAWDPFLDAYLEVKGERDEAYDLLREIIPNIHKAKRETFEKRIGELDGESSSNGKSRS